MDIRYVSVQERPDLVEAMWAIPSPWPPFMEADLIAELCYDQLPIRYPELQLLAIGQDSAGERVLARLNAVPFDWSGRDEDLPDRGWDHALGMAFRPSNSRSNDRPRAVSLIEARIDPALVGRGTSGELLNAARRQVHRLGYRDLLAPIRPVAKGREPMTPFDEYLRRTRDDGTPFDPWLRTHLRIGGRIAKVCPAAMTISAGLTDWRRWTGLPFDVSGPVVVEDALNPVQVSVENGHAVYVEPNVWIHHSVRPGS